MPRERIRHSGRACHRMIFHLRVAADDTASQRNLEEQGAESSEKLFRKSDKHQSVYGCELCI